MAQADGNKVELRYIEETTYATVPSGTTFVWRLRSEDLGEDIEFIASDEIDSGLQLPDNILAGSRGSGSAQVEVSYGAHDEPMRYALNSAAWSTEVTESLTSGTTVTADHTSGSNKLTLSGTVTDWQDAAALTSAAQNGMWIHVAGYSNAVNNGFFRIDAGITLATISVSGPTQMTNEALTGDNVTIKLISQIVNGVDNKSLTLERAFTDLGVSTYAHLAGFVFTGMEVNAAARGKLEGSFSFIGSKEIKAASEIDNSPTAAPTNKVFSVTNDCKGLLTGSTQFAKTRFTSFGMRVTKGDYLIEDAAERFPVDVGKGRLTVGGTLERYYENTTLADQARAITEIPLAIIFQDAAGNGLIYDVPRAILSNPRITAGGGIDSPVVERYDWLAAKHSTQGVSVRIARKAA